MKGFKLSLSKTSSTQLALRRMNEGCSPMATPPKFISIQDYVASITDVGFWWPYVSEIVERHDLPHVGRKPVAGYNATYPTFLYGDVVVKLFGHRGTWRESHAAERAAHILVGTDPKIAAPSLLAEGSLFGDADAPWPYLITERMSGAPWWRADLSTPQKISVTGELGWQIHQVHKLSTVGQAVHSDWQVRDIVVAAKKSSLPHHMIA